MAIFVCPECPAEYTSHMAAEQCGEDDRTQDRRNRAWMNRHRRHNATTRDSNDADA